MSLLDRLLKYTEKTSSCWLWTGYTKPSGHGQLQRGGRHLGAVNAHIAAYELFIGKPPQGYVLHHLCGQKACVNPKHLLPVTRAEHPALHSQQRRACSRGHLYPDYILARRRRKCPTCEKRWSSAYHERQRDLSV